MGDVEAAKAAPLARDRSFGLRQLLCIRVRKFPFHGQFNSYRKLISFQCHPRNWARKVQAEVEQIYFYASISLWRSSAIWEVDQRVAALVYSAKRSDATKAAEEPDI